MALMPYRVAGAALAAGAGYQGYLQALPVLEFVVDPREMRSFARRQIRRLATMAVELASESESGAAGDPPLASDRTAPVPAGTGTTSEWTRGAWQLVQQNTWLFAFPCLAVLWVCSQAMQVLAGIYWAVCAATRLFWQTGSLACRVACWPARLWQLACKRRDFPSSDEEAQRCTASCSCGLPCARSRWHKAHPPDAACLCDDCISNALRPPSLPRGAEYALVPEEHLSEAQLKCQPRRGYNWAEPERLVQTGVYKGLPYTAMLADVSYMNTVRRQGTRAGMIAAGSYLNFVRRHEEAVAAGSGA